MVIYSVDSAIQLLNNWGQRFNVNITLKDYISYQSRLVTLNHVTSKKYSKVHTLGIEYLK